MKTLTKENLIEFLCKHGIFNKENLDWAQSQAETKDIVEKCKSVNRLRWLIEAIGSPMETEYDEKRDPIWAEYDKMPTPTVIESRGEEARIMNERFEKEEALIREICTFERVQEAIGE